MNNKGFAITTIIYGTFILFMLLLVSMLGILGSYKDRLSMLIDNTNGARDIINMSYNEGNEPEEELGEEEPVENQYMVTFDSNGGSVVSSQNVLEGGKVTKPSNPTKSGYYFVEWQLNGIKYNFDLVVNKNMNLVAKWNQNSYSVVAKKVDNLSTSRVLSVYENGELITVNEIQYSDGVKICSGSNPNVNYYAINAESTLRLVLSDGTVVTASLTMA